MNEELNEELNEEVVEDEETDLELEEEQEEKEEVEVKKTTETLEARRARLTRQLEQTNKKLGVDVEKKVKAPAHNDLGESAYLIANGIKDSDEKDLARKLSKETGKDLETLLDSTYFQLELKTLRETKTTEKANPEGSKRSNNTSSDSVEYWIAKGELPPASEQQLRRDVVNARIKKDDSSGIFYNS